VLAMRYFTTLMLILSFLFIHAQTFTITGRILGKDDHAPLQGVHVLLMDTPDTTRALGEVSGLEGTFTFRHVAPGRYKLKATYVGLKEYEQSIIVTNADIRLADIMMEPVITPLEGITVQSQQIRTEMRGDTVEYNAGAYKTNPDANAEDLVTKMPGITVEQGTVKAQGEDVKKVLVDGREFFGDDPSLALRNVPAEIIDRIQVFDKLSDQAQFTGFNDGNTDKTMNIVTRQGMNKGRFGRFFAGYGTDGRYQVGGNLNLFGQQRRLTIIGLSNNVNQQNFSSQDFLGVAGMSGRRGGLGGFGGRGGRRGGGSFGGGPMGFDMSNFFIGQQSGINTTNAIGFNYSDTWGQKIKITASYFFNQVRNKTNSILDRQYFINDTTSQYYHETNDAAGNNYNHRFNMRMQYNIDSSNSFIFTPRLSFQKNHSTSDLTGTNSLLNEVMINSSTSDYNATYSGYDLSGNLLYRHKFNKTGRTVSVNIGSACNNKTGNSDLLSQSRYNVGYDSLQTNDQNAHTVADGYMVSGDLAYTEPLGVNSQLQFSYDPSYSKDYSDKETFLFDSISGQYSIPDTSLSNKYSTYNTIHRGGISYRLRGVKYNFIAGVNYQHTLLTGDQTFPSSSRLSKNFDNLLPMAVMMYKFSSSNNLRIFYRTFTNTPGVGQLQDVIDNTNPLILSTGNPDLKQQYSHLIVARYGRTDPDRIKPFFIFLSGMLTQNYIGNSILFEQADTVLQNGMILNAGSQLTRPVNLRGYWNVRSFFMYGVPVKSIKSNLNLHGGISYSHTPGLINGNVNDANTSDFNGGVVVSSNISENIDFTVAYSVDYNLVKNSIQPASDNNYLYQVATGKINLLPWKGLILGSDISYTLYTGFTSPLVKDYLLWNASIGYKFLKNNAAEVRLYAFDILNSNNSINRTVTDSYIENTQTEVLNRYLMIIFTYNLRNFQGAPQFQPGERWRDGMDHDHF